MRINLLNDTISNTFHYLEFSYITFYKHFFKALFLSGHKYLLATLKPPGSLIILKTSQVAIRPNTLLVSFSEFCLLPCQYCTIVIYKQNKPSRPILTSFPYHIFFSTKNLGSMLFSLFLFQLGKIYLTCFKRKNIFSVKFY